MRQFKIGQYFDRAYPPEAAVWSNQNNATLVQVWAGKYQIQALKGAGDD